MPSVSRAHAHGCCASHQSAPAKPVVFVGRLILSTEKRSFSGLVHFLVWWFLVWLCYIVPSIIIISHHKLMKLVLSFNFEKNQKCSLCPTTLQLEWKSTIRILTLENCAALHSYNFHIWRPALPWCPFPWQPQQPWSLSLSNLWKNMFRFRDACSSSTCSSKSSIRPKPRELRRALW